MQMMRLLALPIIWLVALCVAVLPSALHAADAGPRLVVVISDLHFGLGKDSAGKWDPREDFRWTNALKGFLEEIGRRGNNRVDLVIAGDFLELWQPPDHIRCDGAKEAICSVEQIKDVVRHVTRQHAADLQLLRSFARTGENRLVVVPGNHDAALLAEGVWPIVARALGATAGRVELVVKGVWATSDGKVVVEHGHQIGADVNAFSSWPAVTTARAGQLFVESPWGERFVQELFNKEERAYPIIDNLSPESTGARLRMADRGLWNSAADVARFVSFNLFETTFAQKMRSLGENAPPPCSADQARALGFRLFAAALPADDPFRRELEASDAQARELQRELDALVAALSAEELEHLCSQQPPPASLGGMLESTFIPRTGVLRAHMGQRRQSFPDMRIFVYAHTHHLEPPWDLRLGLGRSVKVLNTGAFQRLANEAGFRERVARMHLRTPSDGLKRIGLEDLAPCYSFVWVSGAGDATVAEMLLWQMSENAATGVVLQPGDPSCN